MFLAPFNLVLSTLRSHLARVQFAASPRQYHYEPILDADVTPATLRASANKLLDCAYKLQESLLCFECSTSGPL